MSPLPELPTDFADFGPAQVATALIAGYLVVGEPFVGYALHRRFEGRLRTDPLARRSFYRRLLVLEWGLALITLVVWLAAPRVDAAQVGRDRQQSVRQHEGDRPRNNDQQGEKVKPEAAADEIDHCSRLRGARAPNAGVAPPAETIRSRASTTSAPKSHRCCMAPVLCCVPRAQHTSSQ